VSTTKAEAASLLLLLASDIDEAMAGDDDADVWVLRLLFLVGDLDPHISRGYGTSPRLRRLSDLYDRLYLGNGERESKEQKIRKLALHPATTVHERESAVRALLALQERRRAD
jgi:hypothetical protein